MKRSIVVLTPASADKKGECVELEYESEPVMYLEPVANDSASDLGKLRANVHEARAKLQHAKSRGRGVAEAQRNLEDATRAAGKMHLDQQKQRQQQRTGGEHGYGTPDPFQRDTRQFAPVRDYSAESDDGAESPSEELSEEQLRAAIRKAVDDLETAQSDGASWTEILRLEAALKVLRDQLDNPSAPPKDTTTAPPRRSHIERPAPPQTPAGQATPAVKKTAGWEAFLADLDDRLAKRALAAMRPGGASPATHRATNALALNWNTFLRDRSLRPA